MRRMRLALAVLCCVSAWAAETQITDTLYLANGEKWSGRIDIFWDTFTAADGHQVVKGSKSVAVSNGAFSISLEPNEGATPGGTAYTLRWYGATSRWSDTAVVPASATPVTLKDIRRSSTLVIFPGQLAQGGAANGQCLAWSAADAAWKPATCSPVASVAGRTGAVVLSASDISGLGGAALLNVGTAAGTVAAGDDARIAGAVQTSQANAPNGYVGLDASGNATIGTTVLPGTAIATTALTTYNLTAANNGQQIAFTAGTDVTLNLTSTVAVQGFAILIIQRGAGNVIPTASGGGITIRQRESKTKTAGQYAVATLSCDIAGDCILAGDLQ